MKNKYSKYLFLILIAVLFATQFFFISPQGGFALNDDWVHTDTILHWVQTGNFRLMPFAGPTFYVPILYGAALTKIFGFSFTLLRESTLVLTFFLLFTFYFLLNKFSNKPTLAFIGTLLLWTNPIFYNLSFTFMADIPALLFLILAIYFYFVGFEKNKNNYLFWGTIFGLFSAFTRQTGILIVVAGFLYLISKNSWSRLFFSKRGPSAAHPQQEKNNLRMNFYAKDILLSFLLPLAIAGAIYTWLNIYQLLPQNTVSHAIERIWRLLGHIKWWLFYIPMYLGLFTLPLTLGWFAKQRKNWKDVKFWLIFFIITDLTIAVRQIWHLQFPYIGNLLSYYGLGPMKSVLTGNLTPLFPSWVWGIITILAAFGLSLIAYLLLFHRQHKKTEPTGFIYLFAILYSISLLIFESFDRYLLPLLLVLIIALLQNIKHVKFSYLTALILISILVLFSLTQTKFYLAWNEARWNLAGYATTLETDKTKIDAGYEWDGWHNYWATLANEKLEFTDQEIQTRAWWQRRFFPAAKPEYIVSFSNLPDYQIIKQEKIMGSNPNNNLYLLKK